MAGLVPAIYVFLSTAARDVDARVKPGHDEEISSASSSELHFDQPRPLGRDEIRQRLVEFIR